MEIRRPLHCEQVEIQDLVQGVVNEVYGGIWTSLPIPVSVEDWSTGWAAVTGTKIVGVALTHESTVEDLWIAAPYRRQGLGHALLSRCEQDIARRRYTQARLRVVRSNRNAIDFYLHSGWQPAGECAHERFPITMLNLSKDLT